MAVTMIISAGGLNQLVLSGPPAGRRLQGTIRGDLTGRDYGHFHLAPADARQLGEALIKWADEAEDRA